MYIHKLTDFFEHVSRDGEFKQTQFANSTNEKSICFVTSEKYLKQANQNPAITCVLTTGELAQMVDIQKGLVVSPTPEYEFYKLHNRLTADYKMRPELQSGIAPSARVHPTAYVDEYAYVGSDVEIGPGAVVLGGCILEQGAFVGPNAVVGADGHFYKRYNNRIFRVLHAGGVILRQGVQVLAGAIVSKALHNDFTIVGAESVVSIKSHIGHGCKIGERCIIAGDAQISGYTELGNDVWIGPSATIGNMLKIGSGVKVEIGSVVIENLEQGRQVSGNFALNHHSNMMNHVRKRRGK